ncbi:MAG TPA: hypothetical protein VET88_06225 [Gammaproteobacteria bacterium]|nr:hypothetical protein [Gammaproteobacteria bacterium]
MRQIRLHADADWCHFCGMQGENQVDVYYPADARQAGSCTPNTQYVRVCADCVGVMQQLVKAGPG